MDSPDLVEILDKLAKSESTENGRQWKTPYGVSFEKRENVWIYHYDPDLSYTGNCEMGGFILEDEIVGVLEQLKNEPDKLRIKPAGFDGVENVTKLKAFRKKGMFGTWYLYNLPETTPVFSMLVNPFKIKEVYYFPAGDIELWQNGKMTLLN